jgi:putative transposase
MDVTKLLNLSRVQDYALTERVCDALTEMLTHGAGRLLKQAVEAEADAFIDERRGFKDERGRRRVVRNGYLAPRKIQTCMGEHAVRVPRVRDLAGNIKYKSRILLPYRRNTEGQKDQFSRAYLAGLSSGDFHEALLALLGRRVVCMSPTAVTRLKVLWRAERLPGPDHELPGAQFADLRDKADWHEQRGRYWWQLAT